ncbi:MAG: DUF456 domain-containing protein [Bacteroidales bacterium]|jgi:uncharacterized protein YqgC (DUF456 family)|nr:DUF456 domain-containing protein [Bacteroidales bacterium]
MNTVLIILAFVCMLVGVVAVFTPVPPAVPVAWAGLLLARLSGYADISNGWLIWSAVIGVLLMVLDYVFPLLTTRKFGGTKYGVWGCMVGLLLAIVGLPFGPGGLVGVFFWPFVGAFAGEFIKQHEFHPALRAAVGSFLGMMAGIVVKVIYCLVLIIVVTIKLF